MVFRSRQNEIEGYIQIFLDYFKEGASWVSCPRPRLKNEMYSLDRKSGNRLNNLEPVFDAANILRAGKDLFYLISESGNELGADWLQSILGDKYRVHKCFNLYDSIHIDSTISLLRPGLALINPARVRKENLPKALRKWKIILCPEMIDIGSEINPPISSVWIGMNLLMLNPSLAIVEKNQVALIKLLERHNIDVIPLSLRHARALGGGFHCVTLDTKREAGYEDYFN